MNKEINITELNRLRSHIDKNKRYLDANYNHIGDDNKKYTISLSMAILIDYIGLNQKEAYDSITDGGLDNKIDALYYSDDEDELNELIIIQSKYKKNDGEVATFTQDEIKLVIESCKKILRGDNFQETNDKLTNKINTYRELLRDNGIPSISIKLFFVTNGKIHNGHKELHEINECVEHSINPHFVDATEYGAPNEFMDGVLKINIKDNNDLTDKIFNYSFGDDKYLGKVVSSSILNLMKFYKETGEKTLLNNNVRYKVKSSKVNKDIIKSFVDNPKQFCFLNNGITMVCNEFGILPTCTSENNLDLKKPNIINGGQTISSLYELYENDYKKYKTQFEEASILIRVFQIPDKYILEIAKATNSQNPINIVDLHSNDSSQAVVKKYFSTKGIGLITKVGEDTTFYNDTITNENILQVYASLYGDEPAKAKLSKRSIFNQFYSIVFNETTDQTTAKKLYRCYEISNFIVSKETKENKSVLSNAFYAIIYTMKNINCNIYNENITTAQINKHFEDAYESSMLLLNEIINKKQKELKTKFSLNNLFKSKEIKDLIDLEFE